MSIPFSSINGGKMLDKKVMERPMTEQDSGAARKAGIALLMVLCLFIGAVIGQGMGVNKAIETYETDKAAAKKAYDNLYTSSQEIWANKEAKLATYKARLDSLYSESKKVQGLSQEAIKIWEEYKANRATNKLALQEAIKKANDKIDSAKQSRENR